MTFRAVQDAVPACPVRSIVSVEEPSLASDLEDAGHRFRHLIRDRDAKFGTAFDTVLASIGIETVLTAPQAPQMNTFAERWIGSVRRECTGRILITGHGYSQRIRR